MPAEVISNRIHPELGQEIVTIMDDFGTELLLHLPVSEGEYRQQRVDAAVAQQTQNETDIQTYAAAHAVDITAALAAGLAKKNAAKENH